MRENFFAINFANSYLLICTESPQWTIPSRSFSIEYTYKSSVIDAQRMGVINLVIDSVNNAVSLDDEFTYSGSASNQTNLQFRANYLDVNGDTTVDTVAIQVLNSTTSDQGYLHFKVNSKT